MQKMDDATAQLVAQLLQEEFADILHAQTRDASGEVLTEIETALRSYQDEIERWATSVSDHHLAVRLGEGIEEIRPAGSPNTNLPPNDRQRENHHGLGLGARRRATRPPTPPDTDNGTDIQEAEPSDQTTDSHVSYVDFAEVPGTTVETGVTHPEDAQVQPTEVQEEGLAETFEEDGGVNIEIEDDSDDAESTKAEEKKTDVATGGDLEINEVITGNIPVRAGDTGNESEETDRVFPSLVVSTFGVAGVLQNWGYMRLAPVTSGNIFNLLYGTIYDRHSMVSPNGERDCRDDLGADIPETQEMEMVSRMKTDISLECIACRDPKQEVDVIQTQCSHNYCRDCVATMFHLSLSDEDMFPRRCCGEIISISLVEPFLEENLVKRYEMMLLEHEDTDRTYCANPRCSQYIPQVNIAWYVGTCQACNTTTCALCKKTQHPGECIDELDESVLEMATAQGWQRCFKCQNIVELTVGCNHIICRCGGEFCYVCGQQWRSCNCPQWDEGRILYRAEEVLQRNARAEDAPAGQAAVAAMVRNLRNCQHTGEWSRVDGVQRCELCNDRLGVFALECQVCHLRACVRCKVERFGGRRRRRY